MRVPPLKTLSELEQELVLERLAALNWNRTRAANSLGKSVRWLRLQIVKYKKRGAQIVDNPRGGMHHATAKLTEDDVREIRASTEPWYTLADKYGVTKTTIYAAKHRLTWRHLK